MQMTLEEYKARFPERPLPVPLEYAGKWIAWNEDCTEIVAHGATLSEVREQAVQCGYAHPVFHKIPRGQFIGRP
jgi:hypothetical protein